MKNVSLIYKKNQFLWKRAHLQKTKFDFLPPGNELEINTMWVKYLSLVTDNAKMQISYCHSLSGYLVFCFYFCFLFELLDALGVRAL